MQEVERIRPRYEGRLVIDLVVPDYYARRPKACMGGWGRRSLNVTPSGRVLPCHAAETIPGLEFWSVRDHSLAEIWQALPGVPGVSRHRLDAGAMPLLRVARGRFRRLPLPGAGDRRRCGGDRSGLRVVAASCAHAGACRTGFRGRRACATPTAAAPRATTLLPFQLAERHGRVARIVVVEQLPSAAFRPGRSPAPRAPVACPQRSGAGHPGPAR